MKSTIKRLSKLSKGLGFGQQVEFLYDAPLFRFNNQREEIMGEVVKRMFSTYLEGAKQGDHPLEYTLNEVCYAELSRLKHEVGGEEEIHTRQWWAHLARNVAEMSETKKRDVLHQLIEDYTEDTAGTFDLDVFRFTTLVVPSVIGLCFKTQDLGEWVLNPLNFLQDLEKLRDLSDRFLIEGALSRVRSLSQKGTIIVVPTHSSNMDSIMVGWGLHDSGIPPVTYGAGKNLFTNPLMSFFMHNLGAYKVDRRIQNTLYKNVLKTYSQVILERGFHSLFFPGGTRSRSNRVETDLKLGLLGTAVSAYTENLVSRNLDAKIFICPLTINYNLVLEAESLIKQFLREEGGSRYFLENDQFNDVSTVLRFAFKTMKMHATTVLRFGEPMDPFGNEVDDEGNSFDSCGRYVEPRTYVQSCLTGAYTRDVSRDYAYTRHTGQAIGESFLRNTVLQPPQVVAWALFEQIKSKYPEQDIFQILKAGGCDTVSWNVFRLTVEMLSQELRRWQDANRLKVAPMIYHGHVGQVVEEGLNSLQSYHTPAIVTLTGVGVVVERLDLVYFYRNRVDSYDIDARKILAQVEGML